MYAISFEKVKVNLCIGVLPFTFLLLLNYKILKSRSLMRLKSRINKNKRNNSTGTDYISCFIFF